MPLDLTFITNEPGKTLRDRFDVLLRSNTRFFDCLVGYFFISGFHRLCGALEKVERIRILVGLKTDRTVFKLTQQARKSDTAVACTVEGEQKELVFESHAKVKDRIAGDIQGELENSRDSAETEAGARKYVEWLRSGKLQVRAYPTEDLHAKVYIMTFSEGDRDKGRVITGSSNLSQAGLLDNLEFNVELKNAADYDFAINKFNELWETGVDLKDTYVDTVLTRSPYAEFGPYELYLKFLYEYFREELNPPAEAVEPRMPEGFKKLKYQDEAVVNAQRVLKEYGGVFLSDVVGLGKTYMSALLARQLDGRSLVIAPPHLLDRDKKGSWPDIFGDFRVPHTDFESVGKLDHLLEGDIGKYANVFIDESHRFRTETNITYETLARICRGKRVILVSATPLNNTPRDILSQLKLFQDGKNSTIPNLPNLERFFTGLEKKLEGLDRLKDRDLYLKAIQANAKAVREKVLKYLMVRRTRTEIEKYYGEDMRKQGLKFAVVQDPEPLYYKFNENENRAFNETIRLLVTSFTLARYKPLEYYMGPKDERDVQGHRNLARFMRVLFIKRLESSFHAFQLTLGRFICSYEQVIAEYSKGNVYISKKHSNKIFELLEESRDEAIEQLLAEDKARKLDAKDFSPEFARLLESDLAALRAISRLWQDVKRDPKWEAFRQVLKHDARLRKGKVIIFSESQETAEYLAERIRTEVEPKTVLFTGNSDEAVHRNVIANFDANARQCRDDYRILVSTEVLSEGVNLHRSNIVINYDIPWNPTRLIQRVGRVNRIDTKFDQIYTYNFFPTDESNDLIKLKEAAEAKIHAFIEMLGADARLLTEGEEIKSHDLFARLTSKKTIMGEDPDEESELEYLTEIREVRDKDPDLFARVKRLPKKARSTRTLTDTPKTAVERFPSLLTYFRKGKLDRFYLASLARPKPVAAAARGPAATGVRESVPCRDEGLAPGENTTSIQTASAGVGIGDAREVDFFEAVRILKPSDKRETLRGVPRDFYDMLTANKAAFDAATSPANDEAISPHRGAAKDAFILRRLRSKEIRLYQGYTEDDELFIEHVRQLLNDGALPKQTTKRVAAAIDKETDPLRVLGILRRDIPREFMQAQRVREGGFLFSPREVILSSYVWDAK
ncbi:MAG: helicase-related protein [Planctomycetota bacterium]|nr:helicase-related protein [Planctomycetota bacterium]